VLGRLEACEILGKSVAVWAGRKLRQKNWKGKKSPHLYSQRIFVGIFVVADCWFILKLVLTTGFPSL
jgi:hypothetical protein